MFRSRISLRPVALFVLVLAGCSRPSEHRRVEIRLWQEFVYAEKSHPKAFQPARLIIEGKRRPALIQSEAGTLGFSFAILPRASLSYFLQTAGRNSSETNAKIIVESEWPKAVRREYVAKSGSLQSVDLTEWANQIVKITFGSSAADWHADQRLLWIDPVLRYPQRASNSVSPGLQEFRNRHRNDNVMIFLFDAARASHLSSYGYYRQTTPAMDSIAEQGVLFDNAVCMIPSTRPSVCTMLTGLYPAVHKVMQASNRLPDSVVTLPQLFRQRGYVTALFSGNPHASLGYDRAFQTVLPDRHKLSEADELADLITDWLEKIGTQPFFTYVHFREPHAPYKPPKKYRALFVDARGGAQRREAVEARYAANLAFADDQFRKVIKQLRKLNLIDRTTIIILSDHGEAFDEHGERGHIKQVYEEMIRIPLIVRFPGEPALAGSRRSKMVGTLDIMPTFLDLFDVSRKGIMVNGTSLLPFLLDHDQAPERLILSMCEGNRPAYSLRSQFFKYIQYRKNAESLPPEFYSLREDPGERTNAIDRYPVMALYYRAELRRKLDQLQRMTGRMPSQKESPIVLDEGTKEALRALGYVY